MRPIRSLTFAIGLLATVIAGAIAMPSQSNDTPLASRPVLPEPTADAARAQIDVARRDVRTRLKAPELQVDLLAYRPVTFPDASLGCPQPDMAYPQVMVEGVVIELRAAGRRWEYHASDRRQPFLCQRDR